jgi:hypothetical protein
MSRFKTRNADLADIGVRAAPVFGRHGMGAEKTGPDPHRPPFGDSPCSAQHLQFVVDVEAVARLDLYRRHALGNHCINPGKRP